MARPFLIALLTLAAVAWPVAGLGPLPAPAPGVPADPTGGSLLDPLAARPSSSSSSSSSGSCGDPVEVVWPEDGPLPVWPRIDPDGCFRRIVDWAIEEVWPWMAVPAAQASGSAEEPAEPTADPAAETQPDPSDV